MFRWTAYSRACLSAIALGCALVGKGIAGDGATVACDVCVYGGTSGGVVAAVQVSRMGKTAVIVEPGKHLGGMTASGLSLVDIGNPRTVGGIAREYFTRLAAKYDRELAWTIRPASGSGGTFVVEPHAAEQLFDAMVDDAKLRSISMPDWQKCGWPMVA